jgi:hypothetical protein
MDKECYVLSYKFMNDHYDGAPFEDSSEDEYDDFKTLEYQRYLLVNGMLSYSYIQGTARCFHRVDTSIDSWFMSE